MAAAITFFNPADATGILDDSWEIQSFSPSTTSERKQGLLATGDEAASQLHNKTLTATIEAECFDASGTLALPAVGTVSETGGFHLDSWSVTLSATGWPRISAQVHKHDDGASHTEGSCRTFTPTVDLTAGFGITRAGIGATLGVGDTAVGIETVTYSMECVHEDVPGDKGNWLAGENRDGSEKLTLTTTGKGATVTAPAVTWDKVTQGEGETNTSADSETFEFEHHVIADVVVPPEE